MVDSSPEEAKIESIFTWKNRVPRLEIKSSHATLYLFALTCIRKIHKYRTVILSNSFNLSSIFNPDLLEFISIIRIYIFRFYNRFFTTEFMD